MVYTREKMHTGLKEEERLDWSQDKHCMRPREKKGSLDPREKNGILKKEKFTGPERNGWTGREKDAHKDPRI